jgi:hypothetical protein
MSTTPNADLQRYLDQAGIHPTGTNWNQIDPNVSGITGALNVDALNRIASSRTQSTVGGTAPTPSGTGSPTSSGTGSNFEFSGFGLSPDPHMEEAARYAKQWESDANMVIDNNQIYNNQMRMFQAEIDAVNQLYGNMLTQAQREGTGRLGSTTAMSARAGTLGSDFGMAQHEQTAGFNREIEGGIRAEQAARIGAIEGNVRKAVAQEIADKTAAKRAGAENWIAYLGKASERRTERNKQMAHSILMQDVDPEQIDWDKMAKEYGVDKNDAMFFYTQAKQERDAQQAQAQIEAIERQQKMDKTDAEIRKIEADIAKGHIITLGRGSMLYDLRTGETFTNPMTYASDRGGSGGTAQGEETNERVMNYLQNQMSLSDEELKADLHMLNRQHNLGLSVSEINAYVAGRPRPEVAQTSFQHGNTTEDIPTIVRNLQSQQLTRREAKRRLTQSMNDVMGGSIPKAYRDALEDALEEIYGATLLQNILPGGRGAW